MTFIHRPFCDCFECTALPEDKILSNHADAIQKLSPNDSKILYAPPGGIIIYISDGTTKKISAGNIVGVANEIITTSGGAKMYNLVKGGSLPKGGMVAVNAFSPAYAIANSKLQTDVKAQTKENTTLVSDALKDKIYSAGGYLDQLKSFGTEFKYIIIVVIIIMLIALFFRIKGTS